MQIPSLIEPADERVLNVIVMQLPRPMNHRAVLIDLLLTEWQAFTRPMRSHRHDVGGAVGQPDAGPGERYLHHLLRKVTGRVHHVLMSCGDAATGRVIISAEVCGSATPAG